jgi:hypothetical protein
MLARLSFLACSLVSFACFAVPIYVIRPFRHQGARELAVALFVRQIGPTLSALCAAIAFAILIFTWRRTRGWGKRLGFIALLMIALGGAFLSRVNVYEQMFHHLDTPQFETAQAARVDKDDMVLTVQINGESRAYPIREMAYHHVVNDTVGRLPIVSTY